MNDLFKIIQAPKTIFNTNKFTEGQTIKLSVRSLKDFNDNIHVFRNFDKKIICELHLISEEKIGLKVIEHDLKEFKIQEYYYITPKDIENSYYKIDLMEE